MGPTHYIKPDLIKMNNLTKFNIRILEEIGAKVIIIPFDSGKRYGKEATKLLLDYLKKYNIVK